MFLSEGVSFQDDLVGAMRQSVKDGVAQRWVSDDAVPFLQGHLRGDEG